MDNDQNIVKEQNTQTAGQKPWHKRTWVRVVALVIVAGMIASELLSRIVSSDTLVISDNEQTQALINSDLAEALKHPIELNDAYRKAVYQEKLEQKRKEKLFALGEKAEKQIADGEYRKAVATLDELLGEVTEEEADIWQLRIIRAQLLFSDGQIEKSSDACTEVIDAGEDEGGTCSFIRSLIRIADEDYEGAREDLLGALENGYTQEDVCSVHIAYCDYYLEDYESVLRFTAAAREQGISDKYDYTILYLEAMSQLQLARYEDSIDSITELLEMEEDADGALHYYRGVCYLALEDYKTAAEDFKAAEKAGFGNSKDDGTKKTMLLYNMGVAAAGCDDPEEAKRYMKQVVSRDDDKTLAEAAQNLLDMYREAEEAARLRQETES